MKLVSKKLNLANRMDQITYLQPKVLVTVRFLKNICAFFIDSIISQRLELISLKRDPRLMFWPRSLSAQAF